MALLAESLVEEWLNRSGFFTIRGIKHGLGELDLLGIRHEAGACVTGWHVEVQASFRPIGYIAPDKSKRSRYVSTRTPEEIEACAREWVHSKFDAEDKVQVREGLWPGVAWSYHLVHAVVRYPQELKVFEREGVTCHPFYDLLVNLCRRTDHAFSGSAGGDLAEIVGYYNSAQSKKPEQSP